MVVMDDLELYLASWFRARLAARTEPFLQGFQVARSEPPLQSLPPRLLVVRDDGTTHDELLTGEASIGLTVLAGTKENPKDAKDAARFVLALAKQLPAPLTPVTRFLGATGPYLVDEAAPKARVYSTLSLAVVGRTL
jgi:hypothetical protein